MRISPQLVSGTLLILLSLDGIAPAQAPLRARTIWEHFESESDTIVQNVRLSAGGRVSTFAVPGGRRVGIRDISRGTNTYVDISGECGTPSASLAVPDARQLVYVCRGANGEPSLHVMRRGGAPRELRRRNAGTLDLIHATSNDKSVLIRWTSRGQTDISLVNLATGVETPLYSESADTTLRDGAISGGIALSADGTLLALTRAVVSGGVSHGTRNVVRTVGTNAEVIVSEPADRCTVAGWTRARSLVFTCDVGSVSDVRLWHGDKENGGRIDTIGTLVEEAYPLAVTSSGTLVYSVHGQTVNTFEVGFDPTTARTTSLPRRLNTGQAGHSMYPVWFDGGHQLSYVEFPSPRVFLRAYPDGQEHAINSDLAGGLGGTAWMPDGSVIVAASKPGVGRGYFRLDPATGRSSAVLVESQPDDEYRGFPDVSADGSELYYRNDRRHEIRVRNLKTGMERVIYQAPGPPYAAIRSVHLSPDGKWLAFLTDQNAISDWTGQRSASSNALRVVPTAGGDVRELQSATWPDILLPVQGFAWMSDSRRIVFVRGRGQKLALWSTAVNGGQLREAGLAVEGLRHPAMHPSGTRLAFAAGDEGTITIRELDLHAP
jgi:WD40 repeat protein